MEAEEIWRPIPGFEPYEASSEGRIRNTLAAKRGGKRRPLLHVLTPRLGTRGYYVVFVRPIDQKPQTRLIHVLVAAAFLPPRPSPAYHVEHIDRDNHNNRAANLRYAPMRDIVRRRMKLKVVNIEDYERIRQEYVPRVVTQDVIAARWNLHQSHVSRIVNRRVGG